LSRPIQFLDVLPVAVERVIGFPNGELIFDPHLLFPTVAPGLIIGQVGFGAEKSYRLGPRDARVDALHKLSAGIIAKISPAAEAACAGATTCASSTPNRACRAIRGAASLSTWRTCRIHCDCSNAINEVSLG
jgi:hypothetical protein